MKVRGEEGGDDGDKVLSTARISKEFPAILKSPPTKQPNPKSFGATISTTYGSVSPSLKEEGLSQKLNRVLPIFLHENRREVSKMEIGKFLILIELDVAMMRLRLSAPEAAPTTKVFSPIELKKLNVGLALLFIKLLICEVSLLHRNN